MNKKKEKHKGKSTASLYHDLNGCLDSPAGMSD